MLLYWPIYYNLLKWFSLVFLRDTVPKNSVWFGVRVRKQEIYPDSFLICPKKCLCILYYLFLKFINFT